ncbi:transglutaminase domain-containing protein [Parasulfuritortus cantonensis]|uniref:Transglutaminase domain-containing protein n=1 Tax=Parasulfuritortus cantonensis TaxID=2528202 RepID=A0A4V2NX75_9PROT|nr:transglutaminase-like domain-containing protein [Parasulfuritortus cantonensis]TCJ20142.1 transglutaminase domain-containing protein [Parasulfuritortus cantonensis]
MSENLLQSTVRHLLSVHPPANERECCVVLHDFVRDNILFGFTSQFESIAPEQTLRLGRGHCNAQADLFRALLEEAGITARLRFVYIDKRILRYAVPTPIYLVLPHTLFHAVTQVRVSNRWLNTDSYLFNPDGFKRQKDQLTRTGLPAGFGLTESATCYWDGNSDAFAQANPDALTAGDEVFPNLRAATDAQAGNNNLLGIHFNTWLGLIPRPLKHAWNRYINSRL